MRETEPGFVALFAASAAAAPLVISAEEQRRLDRLSAARDRRNERHHGEGAAWGEAAPGDGCGAFFATTCDV